MVTALDIGREDGRGSIWHVCEFAGRPTTFTNVQCWCLAEMTEICQAIDLANVQVWAKRTSETHRVVMHTCHKYPRPHLGRRVSSSQRARSTSNRCRTSRLGRYYPERYPAIPRIERGRPRWGARLLAGGLSVGVFAEEGLL